jgi:hypothetical protein
MAMLVLLLEDGGGMTSLDASTAGRLGDLGITNVSVLRDESTVAVVLDGWAFDPALSAVEASAAFGGARPIFPVLQTVLSPNATRHLPPVTEQTPVITTALQNERSI